MTTKNLFKLAYGSARATVRNNKTLGYQAVSPTASALTSTLGYGRHCVAAAAAQIAAMPVDYRTRRSVSPASGRLSVRIALRAIALENDDDVRW